MAARSLLTRIWLTLKQHRFETIALTVVCVGLTVAALIEAYRLNSMNVSFSCFQSYQGPLAYMSPDMHLTAEQIRCAPLVESFQNLQRSTDMEIVRMMLMMAPIIVGIVFGAPMVARELEQGTAPLSWSLSGSRRRWLLGKVLAGVVLIVPLMLAVGLAADVLQAAISPGLNVYAAFENYMGRGVPDVFWALAAFAGTVALGTILGRTLPALILALVICFFARSLWEPVMTHYVLQPLAVQPTDSANYSYLPNFGYATVNLPIYDRYYLDGKPWPGDQNAYNAWWNEHMPVYVAPDPNATPNTSSDPSATMPPYGVAVGPIGPVQPVMPDGPQAVTFVIPGSQYWPITALESGLLLLGSLFCGAVALVWVDRRRPY